MGTKGALTLPTELKITKDLKQIWYVNIVQSGGVTQKLILFSVFFNFEIFHNKNKNIHRIKKKLNHCCHFQIK